MFLQYISLDTKYETAKKITSIKQNIKILLSLKVPLNIPPKTGYAENMGI